MTTTSSSSTFMLLLRGGVSRKDLSPQQFQQQIENYMNWIDALQRKGHFLAGQLWRKRQGPLGENRAKQ